MAKQLATFIVTFGYIGKIKYGPGTFGSLVAFPICYLILLVLSKTAFILPIDGFTLLERQLLTIVVITASIILILFVVGIYYTNIYLKYTQDDDPKEVVIDEVVGQMLTIFLSSAIIGIIQNSTIKSYLSAGYLELLFLGILPFILFRLFDIFKPWPINWCDENIKGGFGVMCDDLLAAVFATVVYYAMMFLIIDNFFKLS